MTITTKYDVGDEVYVIERAMYEGIPAKDRLRWNVSQYPEAIMARHAHDLGCGWQVFYDGIKMKHLREENCFPTQEEAQTECNRRNQQ